MNPIHAWVDPEEIRKLAARLMTPYVECLPQSNPPMVAGTTPQHSAQEILTPEIVSPPAVCEPPIQTSPPVTTEIPHGQTHPARVGLRQMLPEASAFGFGPNGDILFDDGKMAHLRFLATATGLRPITAGSEISWASLQLQAGQFVCVGILTSAVGTAGMVVEARAAFPREVLQSMEPLLREI